MTITDTNSTAMVNGDRSGELIQCELLYFVMGVIDKHPDQLVRSTLIDFFREDEIMQAKHLLLQSSESIGNLNTQNLSTKRIGANKAKSCVDDIMGIMKLIDENKVRDKLPTFCAVDRRRVPLIVDELFDIAAMRVEVSQLRQQSELLSTQLGELSSIAAMRLEIDQLRQQMSTMSSQLLDISHRRSDTQVPATGDSGDSVAAIECANAGKDHPAVIDTHIALKTDLSAVDRNDIVVFDEATGEVSATSYADVAKVSMGKFQQVHHRNKKNKNKILTSKPLIGNSKSETTLSATAKRAVIGISRLKIGTTSNELCEFLRSKGVTVFSCYEYNDKLGRFAIMRVCVLHCELHKIYVPDMWPVGVVIRPWSFKARQTEQSDSGSEVQV